jgi:hypothetical protein
MSWKEGEQPIIELDDNHRRLTCLRCKNLPLLTTGRHVGFFSLAVKAEASLLCYDQAEGGDIKITLA